MGMDYYDELRFERLESRLEKLESRIAYLEDNMETHKQIETFYCDLINQKAYEFAKVAVDEILQHPIEMTMQDIEAAFGHKIKIVEERSNER